MSKIQAKLEMPKLSQVLDRLFVLTEEVNQDVNAQTVFDIVNDILPKQVQNVAMMGRHLASHLGDRLRSEKIGQKMCYNLTLRE